MILSLFSFSIQEKWESCEMFADEAQQHLDADNVLELQKASKYVGRLAGRAIDQRKVFLDRSEIVGINLRKANTMPSYNGHRCQHKIKINMQMNDIHINQHNLYGLLTTMVFF